jgi:carotenoid cleavage dioxygenase-like enzyme
MAASPSEYLTGLRSPVRDEVTLHDLKIQGELPKELNGIYLCNSPNPRYSPSDRYHWFDGDGMVHGVHINQGKATYRNRYVQTAGFIKESEAGHSLWKGILDPIQVIEPDGPDKNTGNTDLVWHAGRLLALWWLGGVPYEINVSDLTTKGPVTYNDKLNCGFASHPKVDLKTNEMMFFDYSPYEAPYLSYGLINGKGELEFTTAIDVPGPRLFHDIAITQNHTIFLDLPMLWDKTALSTGKRRISFDKGLPSRYGIIPRHGGEVKWFEGPSCYVYHTINAYEVEDEIVMTGCRIDNPIPSCAHDDEPHIPRLYFLRLHPFLTRWRFNLKTGEMKEEKLDDVPTEFPRINDNFLGRKSRYAYNPRIAKERTLLFDGVIKYDLETGHSDVHELGNQQFMDEAVFVPKPGAIDEDDGWLVSSAHDRSTGRNELLVLDAKNINAEPIARVHIPRHVPTGFHACWVPQEEIE